VLDGVDLRALPLSLRKTNLARLLARRPDGIFVAPFEQGEIGPDLFRHTCMMGLEGLVSKRRDRQGVGGASLDRARHLLRPALGSIGTSIASIDHATDLRRFNENRNPGNLSQFDARPPDCDSVIVRSVLS
jgi:hypothetical protein